jgi:hypothetical protein
MYQAEISRGNPTAFLFVLDQSRSMARSWGGPGKRSKAQELADAINKILYTMVIRCSKGDDVRDWFHVGVIGYGGERVGPCLGGELAGEALVPIGRLASYPLRLEERGRTSVKSPVWIDPTSKGETPMCEALRQVERLVARWVADHVPSYPPTIIHVTDGGSSDGDPSEAAEALRGRATEDGNVLLFNIHVSSTKGKPIRFPDSDQALPDDYAKMLFRTASVLPAPLRREAAQEGFAVSETSRGFAFNADLTALVHFLDLGTRASNLR